MAQQKDHNKILREIENILDETEDTLGQLRMKSLVISDKIRDGYESLVDKIYAKQLYLRERFGKLKHSDGTFRQRARIEFSQGVNEIRGLFRVIGRRFK